MPKNTRVHRCVDALKKAKKESGSAFAICQASTNQSYATGKKLKEAIAAKVTKSVADKAAKKLGDENDDKWEAEETKKGYWTPTADDTTGYTSKTSDNADDDFKHGRWTDETRSKKYGKKLMKKNKQTNEGRSTGGPETGKRVGDWVDKQPTITPEKKAQIKRIHNKVAKKKTKSTDGKRPSRAKQKARSKNFINKLGPDARSFMGVENSSRAYKQIGLVIAEALGHRVDEIAPLVALGAAARVGAGVVARGAAAAARLAAQGAKSGAKGLGKGAKSGAKALGQGAKKAAVGAKDMAVDAGKEKLISVAQDKAADAKNKVVGRVKNKLSKGSGLQAGPEGVAIGVDAAKKRGELKAQSDSDTDLEEGKIMNKYVRTLSEMSVGKMADMARRGREQRKAKGELKSADSAIGRIRRNLPTSQANTFQHRVLNPDATKPRSRSQGDAEMGDQRKVPTSGEDTGMRGHDQGRGQSRVAKKAAKADEDKQRAAGAEKAAKKKAERKWKVKPVASGGTDEAGRPLRTESISDTYSRLAHIFLEAFAGPTASKYGDSRSSAGIKDPQVKADAKKAKARMDKKLGVKTNPRAKDAVQAAMNTRRSAARRGETPAGSIDNLKR